MSAVVEDLLRLAWQANAGGRPGMRDALLTLAVAEGGADDAVLAERCRKLLIRNRPDHPFAASPTLGQALARPKVVDALAKLRLMYPPVRVRHLLLRAEAARGPYRGWTLPVARVLEDLAPAPSNGKPHRETEAAPALPFRGAEVGNVDPDGKVAIFYLSVLLAIAILLNSVLRPDATDARAA